MKARVKATGEIIEISTFQDNGKFPTTYDENELEFLIPNDYWEKLKHQYAGMAMQGMLSNCKFPEYSTEGYYKHNIANNALEYATTLIDKLKEEPNEGKALLYAVNKTAEKTKKEILRKAEKWLMKYFVEDHYGMSPAGFGVFFQMFKQAMED